MAIIDAADAIVRGDNGFEKRWLEWLSDAPRDIAEADLQLAKQLAYQWWHMGVVRGVALMRYATTRAGGE
jgi:hypothetical protein